MKKNKKPVRTSAETGRYEFLFFFFRKLAEKKNLIPTGHACSTSLRAFGEGGDTARDDIVEIFNR